MKFQILSIEIPPSTCTSNSVIINTNQIKNSKTQIVLVGSRAQARIQFTLELFPQLRADVDCLMQLPSPVNCEALLNDSMTNTTGKVKSQLSFDGTNYILTALI